MNDFRSRLARLKEISFESAIRAIGSNCSIEIPDSLPGWICCPIHSERTPSLKITDEFWYCHGCKRGSDALDFLSALEALTLPEAVARLEGLLGLPADAAEAAAARARAMSRPTSSTKAAEAWTQATEELAETFLARILIYLRSPDPIVLGVAEHVTNYVFDELREIGSAGPPIVSRARRERLRELRLWAAGLASGIERDVEKLTGRDRLDVAMLARGLDPERVRAEQESLRPLRDALRERERAIKRHMSRAGRGR